MTVLSLLRRVGRFFFSKNDVYFFVGEATAGQNHAAGYPAGQRYYLLVFSRQLKGTEPDWELAQSDVEEVGWINVELERVGKVNPEKNATAVETSRAAYASALKNGCSIVAYRDDPESEVTPKTNEV